MFFALLKKIQPSKKALRRPSLEPISSASSVHFKLPTSVCASLPHPLLDMQWKTRFPSNAISHSIFNSILVHFLPSDYCAMSDPSWSLFFVSLSLCRVSISITLGAWSRSWLPYCSINQGVEILAQAAMREGLFKCTDFSIAFICNTIQHQRTTSTTISQDLRSHMLGWLAELEIKVFDIL